MIEAKTCTSCGATKPLDAFHRHPRGVLGLQARCKPCQYAATAAWKRRNTEKVKQQRADWHAANRASQLTYAASWHRAHAPEVSARQKAWRSQNPDRVKQYKIERRATQKKAGGTYTRAEFRALCAAYGNECLACGATNAELVPDHVIALATGGSNGIENIQPLCRPCNSKKNTRTADYRPSWRARQRAA